MRTKNIFLPFLLVSFLLNANGQQVLQDKIVVLTDRELYLPGETIWLKAFYLERTTNALLPLNTIGYIELVKDRQPFAQQKIPIEKGSANGYLVLPADLSSGVYQLRMYTNWMKNFGIDAFFHKNISIIQPAEKVFPVDAITSYDRQENLENKLSLDLILSKEKYKQREKVSIKGKLDGGRQSPIHLVVSVYLVDSNHLQPFGINTLLSQQQKDISASMDSISYLPELDHHFVEAIIQQTDRSAFGGDTAFLSLQGATPRLYTAKVNGNGQARFVLNKPVFGKTPMIAQVLKNDQHFGNLEILSPFFDEYRSINEKKSGLQQVNNFQSRLLAQQLSGFSDTAFYVQEPSTSDTLMFFGKAPYIYNLDDFTRFPTMEEVLREYVVEVLVQKNGSKYSFESISRTKEGLATVHKPISLINAVPVSANTVIKVDPLKISHIDILPKKYYYGNAFFDGIISLHTYSGTLGEIELDPGVLPIDYEGLQQPRNFANKIYADDLARKSRKPDFRTTLYWNPDLELNANGEFYFEFYTSDMKGDYMMVIQGMDEKGNAGSIIKKISVEK